MFVSCILVLMVFAVPSLQLGPQMGPVGRLDFKKLEECPKVNSALKLQMSKDGKGRRVFNAQLTLASDYDKKYTFKVVVNKWTGSEYKKNMMKYEGVICDYVNKYMPDIRKRIYNSAKISGDCAIKKGKYNVKNIYAVEKDLKIPALPYGTFRAEFQIFDSKKKSVACYNIDIDSVPK